jgi:hypothetical protein
LFGSPIVFHAWLCYNEGDCWRDTDTVIPVLFDIPHCNAVALIALVSLADTSAQTGVVVVTLAERKV